MVMPGLMLSLAKKGILPFLGDLPRHDLVGEGTVQGGPFRLVVAAQGDLRPFPPGDAEVLGDEFGGVAHDIGFADEHAQRRVCGVDRPVLGMGNEVGAAVEGMNQVVDEVWLERRQPHRAPGTE